MGPLLVAFLAGSLLGAARCQELPLEGKARLDAALEAKADALLARVLGPDRAKTGVDATVDLTRFERFRVTGEAGGRAQTYERTSAFAPGLVKRLDVALLVDRRVPAAERTKAADLVAALLQIDPSRGDEVKVIAADLPPAWRDAWRSPWTLGRALRDAALSALALLALGALGVLLVRLARSRDPFALRTAAAAPPPSARPAPEDGPPETAIDEPAGVEAALGGAPISARPEQAAELAALARGQDPENLALVISCLRPETRRAFLAELAPEERASALGALGKTRFVDPEIVSAVKRELERRLSGLVGGPAALERVLGEADPQARREALSALEGIDAELARALRARVLPFDARPAAVSETA